MNFSLVERFDPNGANSSKKNKCALKLLGVKSSDLTEEDLLESVSVYIHATAIEALFYDHFLNFYVIFLTDIESMCILAGKRIQAGAFRIRCLPLLESYIIHNVYPSIRQEELRDYFSSFGMVFEIISDPILPNSSRFSHVLSGKREISFLLQGDQSEISIPMNVAKPPFKLRIVKSCSACLTEGHSLLNCPDRDEVDLLPIFQQNCERTSPSGGESDDSLSAIIKTEEIPGLKFEKVKHEIMEASDTSSDELGSLSELQEMSDQNDSVSSDFSEVKENLKEKKISTEEQIPSAIHLSPISKMSSTVVASSELKIVDHDITRKVNLVFSQEADKCIRKVQGVLPPEVIKTLMQSDARNKTELATLVFNYTDDMNHVLTQLDGILSLSIPKLGGSDIKFMRKLSTLIGALTKYTK